MALEIMTDDVKIIQSLSDYPNQEEGLTASEMKAKFDEAAARIKNYLNDRMVPEVNGKLSQDTLDEAVADAVELAFQSFDLTKIGAAPAGFGLGVYGAPFDFSEVDGVRKNGWYAATCPNTTICGMSFHYAFMEVAAWDANNCRQTLYPVSSFGVILTRNCFSGTWQPWECLNPPMMLGVEYRTTERWKGKVVYTKALDCGTFPATAGIAEANHGLTVTAFVECKAEIYNTGGRRLCAPYHSPNGDLLVSVNENGILLYAAKDGFNAYGAIVNLKYTKD